MTTDEPPIRVVFVLLAQSLVLDWAGPAEALRIANQLLRAAGQPERFAIEFVGPEPQAPGSVGIVLSHLGALPTQWDARPAWVVLVGMPARAITADGGPPRAVLHWLRGLRLQTGRLELVTVCAGALLAAHAGLLAGRRATTHHQHLDELRVIEPRCDVAVNRVFVLDAPVYSSAGVTTGIDLVLHRIAQVCGEALAAQVAQTMVMPLRRGPHDPELSPFLTGRNHLHPALHRVQDAVSTQVQQDWTAARMAEVACVSPRHLARLFQEHAGLGPLDYLGQIRLAVARQALAGGAGVAQAARQAGFHSDTQLRRTWKRHRLPGTPSRVDAAA